MALCVPGMDGKEAWDIGSVILGLPRASVCPSKMDFKEFLLLLSGSLSLQIKSLRRLEAGTRKLGSSA